MAILPSAEILEAKAGRRMAIFEELVKYFQPQRWALDAHSTFAEHAEKGQFLAAYSQIQLDAFQLRQ